MSSMVTNIIASADAQGRYINSSELDRIKSFVTSAERTLRIANLLQANREHIVIQAANLLFIKQPKIIFSGEKPYVETITATCLRDLDYYLRLLTYGLVAGSVSPIAELGLVGVHEVYRSLGIPLSAVAEGIFAMEVVTSSILSEEDANEAHIYFEYIINSFDGITHNSKNLIIELHKQQPDNSTNLQLQDISQELSNSLSKITFEYLDKNDQSWEPRTYIEWLKLDKLVQQLQRKGIDNQENFAASAIAFFDSWKSMPIPLKKLIWREREIMAALCERINSWEKIPTFSHIGVAKKTFDGHEELVGIITLTVSPDDYFYDKFSIPRYINVDSLISDFANQKQVRILLEYVMFNIKHSKSIVIQGDTNNILVDIPNTPTLALTRLQSGDLIVGSNKNGHLNESKAVTLTTFVVPQTSSEILEPHAMSVMHGFTAGYTEVSTYTVQPSVKVGRVVYKSPNQQEQAEKLDVSLIKIEKSLELNPFLKWVEETPGQPFPTWTGMLVQMYGGVSGHVTGFINQSMVVFPGPSSSVIPEFTAIIQSQPGDSGSLLVAGNASGDLISDAEIKGLDSSQVEKLRFAMVGMLIGGAPSGGSYPNLTYFRPIMDICQQLRVKPYLKKHLSREEQEK